MRSFPPLELVLCRRLLPHAFGEQGDFKIRAGEGLPAVTVHRSILAARSGFFRALLESGMGDARHGELTLKVGGHAPQHPFSIRRTPFCAHGMLSGFGMLCSSLPPTCLFSL